MITRCILVMFLGLSMLAVIGGCEAKGKVGDGGAKIEIKEK